ncbi:hypothetical protein [Clostridium sp.]|nr:hypothetical protein [uncultured Clostridium sp.]
MKEEYNGSSGKAWQETINLPCKFSILLSICNSTPFSLNGYTKYRCK